MYQENPFAGYGNIVQGERFIGRKQNIDVIRNRIVLPKDAGNLAIIGEPRIGKSSLVSHTLYIYKNELKKRKVLPIWINLATFKHSSNFFKALVSSCFDELYDSNLNTEAITLAKEKAFKNDSTWSEGYSYIQRFFKKVRENGVRVLFILDEFDHARHLFQNDITGFQGLRELAYRPEWRVSFITTSRRTIREIEEQTQAISTLDGIFQKHYLDMFTEEDLLEHFSRYDSLKIDIKPEIKNLITSYCGGYPYLLEIIGFRIFECLQKDKSDIQTIDRTIKNTESSLIDHYDCMIELMREDQSLNILLQILIGPTIDVKPNHVDEFIRTGVIKQSVDGFSYEAFSPHFQDYLNIIERQVELWPIWKQTEQELRKIITSKMFEHHGADWINVLEKTKPNIKKIFNKCKDSQEKEINKFGNRASRNLIDFTYPYDLFQIIFSEWNIVFREIMGKDKSYWDQRAKLLSKIRTPLAHNRDNVLAEYERQQAEGFCREIISILS